MFATPYDSHPDLLAAVRLSGKVWSGVSSKPCIRQEYPSSWVMTGNDTSISSAMGNLPMGMGRDTTANVKLAGVVILPFTGFEILQLLWSVSGYTTTLMRRHRTVAGYPMVESPPRPFAFHQLAFISTQIHYLLALFTVFALRSEASERVIMEARMV